MPLQATSGAASYDAFGGNGVAVVPAYIEDVFSCFLYTGNSSTQTITNGIDLSGKGGLVWLKSRDAANYHELVDSSRALIGQLHSNSNDAPSGNSDVSTFNSNGFSLTFRSGNVNTSGEKEVSWSFRKQPKFFDIQTWTGSGANRTISHSLGSVPACIMVKRTDTTDDWAVYHRSLANTEYLVLNSTAAKATGATRWNSTTPTSTVFSLGTDATVNASAGTYVAYIFAHDAGGFGLTGTDNVISCGSYTGNGSTTGPVITLGYEPQWLLTKRATGGVSEWELFDNMRGIATGGNDANLLPNSSSQEGSFDFLSLTSTGFQITNSGANTNSSSDTYIYIAIRRGPMKVPTTGTSVFSPVARTGTGAGATITGVGFPPDLISIDARSISRGNAFYDRLRGGSYLRTYDTASELVADSFHVTNIGINDITLGANPDVNGSGTTYINYFFRRAPSFFDEVCYRGTGSATTFSHNLQAVPELIITKCRGDAFGWGVYSSAVGNTAALFLETTGTPDTNTAYWNNTTPTSTVFSVGSASRTNRTSNTMVAYLFATCAGVSKVGSYTGTGTTKQIDCGFTAGARFVLIKRTDSTGDWYVWDTARGIVSGNDPYLLLNSTAAEVTNTDYIDTYSAGFEISSTAPAAINASAGTFLFLAIA